jgi:hypothetical protein
MGLFLISCGGAATPKAEAPDEPATVAATHDDGAPSPKSEDKPASDAKTEETTGKGTSEDDLKTVLQLVIEDGELDEHMHLTEPGRFPLKVAGKDLPSGIALTKAGQPVKILAGEPVKKDAALVITKIEISGSEATVGYRFDIEGLVGTAHLKKASYGWELTSSRVVEHYKADPGKK